MEFITELPDKRTIQKQEIGINPFLIENNVEKIEKITEFFSQHSPLLLVNGFMGMRLYNDGLHFAPKLPDVWDSCTFNINYGNASVRIRAEKDKTRFTLTDGDSMRFTVYGEEVTLSKAHNEITISRF